MENAGAFERVRSPYDLPTYQKRLRHLKSVSMRNLQCRSFNGDDMKHLDVYFTIHKDSKSPAVYWSEKITGSMNPTWRGFDASSFEDKIDTISRVVVIKIWIQLKSKIRLLVDLEVGLKSLVFLADRLQVEGMKYLPNTLIFGLFDKYFIQPPEQQRQKGKVEENINSMKMLHVYQVNTRSSYNTSSLSRVQTVLRAVKQTQSSVNKLHQVIQDRLISSQHSHNKSPKWVQIIREKLFPRKDQLTDRTQGNLMEREELLLKINQLKSELRWQTNRLQLTKDQFDVRRDSIRARYERLKENKLSLKESRVKQEETRQVYNQQREKWIKESAQLLIRRKQLIGELSTSVFPVTENEKGDYSICGVRLPHSENYQGHDETMVAVSLGYTCHLTIMIAQILNLPLRYMMEFRGSRSQIRDHIHIRLTEKDRDFPLFSKGKEKFQFNYGVFLLNKNISQLRFYCGLGTSNLRLTLPNIKTLLELRLGVKGEYSIPRSLTAPSTIGGGGSSNNSVAKEGAKSTTNSSTTSSLARQDTALLQSLDTEINNLHTVGETDFRSDVSLTLQKPEKFDEEEELFAKTEDSFFKLPKMSNLSTDSKIAQCDDVIDAINIKANYQLQTDRNSNGVALHSQNSTNSLSNCDNTSHNSTDSNSSMLQNGGVTITERKDSESSIPSANMINPIVTRTKDLESEEFHSSIET
ncbi:hypothetical protein LOTGIDRAFT_158830 [Lottia gigantea]|uniref:C2 domain-containing protein n=1 Tax=Lottia gigantea TaxID=225164 RepID=V4ANX6_LOTGI|nr:hypothetical protein LOTGIDRAFT_158830 [Lottia gigantea]ESO98877.1 hypothetical protein LOTGIDRAFT_158830 [Lottia gigantea]